MTLKDELIDGVLDTATEEAYHLVAEGEITVEQADEIIHMVLQGDWVEASQLLEHYKEQEGSPNEEEEVDPDFSENDLHAVLRDGEIVEFVKKSAAEEAIQEAYNKGFKAATQDAIEIVLEGLEEGVDDE